MEIFTATTNSALRANENRRGSALFATASTRIGREIVWLVIAAAFCVVELLVFLTDLPVAKYFHRRETSKSSGLGR